MVDRETLNDTAYKTADDLYNKKVTPVATPKNEIGIDLENSVMQNIADTAAIKTATFDASMIESFTNVSRSRNELYDALDDMSNDSTLAAVLETYAEDATETNERGDIMWCESDNPTAAAFVTYLLNAFNINKNIYKWAHSLCKYGDVYLRLYRESEYDDLLFDKKKKSKKDQLNEEVKLKIYSKNDNYVHYLEMVPNPAQVFELTRFGKTAAYIKTDTVPQSTNYNDLQGITSLPLRYTFNKGDVELYTPTEFVHASLEDNSSRVPEEVQLFITDDKSYTYSVKRGQSLLYSSYKVWRQLMLLENSVLLNRVTQSSIVRVIGVEVGDMPKENVPGHMMNIKQLIEQKAALDVGNAFGEYNNPGPIVNNVYIPTRNGQGAISTSQIGGDVDVGDLVDLDYYNDKLFGALRVPKQYFGKTDDGAGFSGGQSLSIISSRYAKMVKRIQNTLIQMITDAINLVLIDTDNDQYINKFKLRMQAPTTQEEVDRRDNQSNKVGLVRDIMDTLADIETPSTKLSILKSLLSSTINDNGVVQLIQEEIDKLAAQEAEENAPEEENYSDEPVDYDSSYDDVDLGETTSQDFSEFETPLEMAQAMDAEEESAPGVDMDSLPSPEELDIGDLSDATNPNL